MDPEHLRNSQWQGWHQQHWIDGFLQTEHYTSNELCMTTVTRANKPGQEKQIIGKQRQAWATSTREQNIKNFVHHLPCRRWSFKKPHDVSKCNFFEKMISIKAYKDWFNESNYTKGIIVINKPLHIWSGIEDYYKGQPCLDELQNQSRKRWCKEW